MRAPDNFEQREMANSLVTCALVVLLLLLASPAEGFQRDPVSIELSVGMGAGYTDSNYIGSNVGFSAYARGFHERWSRR